MKFTLLLLSIISLLHVTPNYAKEKTGLENSSLANIIKVKGRVKVLSKNSIKKHKAKNGELLHKGDTLITYAKAKVFITLADKSKIILDENSQLSLINSSKLKQTSGEIYYKIQKRHKSKGLKIETPFSIIGIKGTEFIVNSSGDGEIALNEGLLGIEALRASYELHREKVLSEFDEYVRKQNEAYENYLHQTQDDIVTYVKELKLKPLKILNFKHSDNCKNDCESYVSEKKFNATIQKRFEKYQQILDEF